MKKVFLAIIFLCGLFSLQAQDTLTTGSGLKYIVIKKGSGPKAETNKAVEVHYTGSLLNGKVFDSSRERGEPIEFILGAGQVIRGWDEGIALMNVGDNFKLIIPSSLGYGASGAGDVIPPNADLLFDVELMSVSEPKTPIGDILLEAIIFKGVDSAIIKYNELKQNSPEEYNFKESQLNMLGYQLLQAGRTDDAIKIFQLNVEAYPQSANVYDSLGEAYMYTGKNDLAIENYRKCLAINPDSKNAAERLKELGQSK